MIGRWDWIAATDRARVDGLASSLFDLDPSEASHGLPLSLFIERIHPEDREHVFARIRHCRQAGSPFIAEYRVISADGQICWVLDRGRFIVDHYGRPVSGAGILVDITELRIGSSAFPGGDGQPNQEPLDRAAELAIATQEAITQLEDPALKAMADALLFALGHALVQNEVIHRRKRMN
ncbi:PAS domain-containing protein [Methylobacterium sp. NMS12]|uniref:PAS domain-containing protein n=1 Tax=Methylobacterium sp. NMS12 TaxID=3079766 RepID=UPI003F88221A